MGQENFRDFDLDIGGFNSVYVGQSMMSNQEDLDYVVDKILWGTFTNQGQQRDSVQSILVNKEGLDKFTDAFIAKVKEELIPMDPAGMRCKYGPIKHQLTLEKSEAFVEDALSKGGVLLHGGKRTSDREGMGQFFEPTVIGNAMPDMRI